MNEVKVLSKAILQRLNNKAIRGGANRTLRESYVRRLRTDNVYPVSKHILHNDVDVRCTIVLNDKGDTGVLDMTLEDFNKLPVVHPV